MTSWGVTFTKQVLRWIGELKWPLVPDERPITWAEFLISFRMYSGMRLPVAHPRNKHIYLTPGIHRIHALGLRTLGTDIWSFKNALNTISSIVNQDLLPWNRAEKKCNTALVLGAKLQTSGFALRPIFPCQTEVIIFLQQYFATQRGRPGTSVSYDLPLKTLDVDPRPRWGEIFDAIPGTLPKIFAECMKLQTG